MAVGHTILGIVCAMLITGQSFRDLGTTYFDRRDAEQVRRRLTRRLEALGYTVTLSLLGGHGSQSYLHRGPSLTAASTQS